MEGAVVDALGLNLSLKLRWIRFDSEHEHDDLATRVPDVCSRYPVTLEAVVWRSSAGPPYRWVGIPCCVGEYEPEPTPTGIPGGRYRARPGRVTLNLGLALAQ